MKKIFFSLLALALCAYASAQIQTNPLQPTGTVLDQIVAIVGSNIIKASDIEKNYLQMLENGNLSDAESGRCEVFEHLLIDRLLLHQAALDSIKISDEDVDERLNQRLRYFISQFGSKEKFEEYYKKTVDQFKDEFRDVFKNQLLSGQIQDKITSGVKITPSDVRNYFSKIPADSIPMIDTEYELAQIIKTPQITPLEKEVAKARINELRERITRGEKFASLATLYSEDPGSAKKGGELGYFGRGEMFAEFEAAAFALREKGELSPVVETQAGFHILQLIERKGEYVNVRHILIMPKISPYELQKAAMLLDSVYTLLKEKKITFEEAVAKYSDDPNKINGGVLLNPYTGNAWFSEPLLKEIKMYSVASRLNVGEYTQPLAYQTDEGKDAYRIVYMKAKIPAHKANMKDDYDKIQQAALEQAKTQAINKWAKEAATKTYIKISDDYKYCTNTIQWLNSK